MKTAFLLAVVSLLLATSGCYKEYPGDPPAKPQAGDAGRPSPPPRGQPASESSQPTPVPRGDGR